MTAYSSLSSVEARRHGLRIAGLLTVGFVAVALGGCGRSEDKAAETTAAQPEPAAAPAATMPEPGKELPIRKIPNVPPAGEAYYAPDNLHLITSAKDKDSLPHEDGSPSGLTYTFTDTGEDIRRINDHGQDACSYFFPDQKRIVWTSTRDNMDMPVGNWSDVKKYPQGPELYVSDLNGGNIVRLTNNKVYEAEVSVSPDGQMGRVRPPDRRQGRPVADPSRRHGGAADHPYRRLAGRRSFLHARQRDHHVPRAEARRGEACSRRR